MEERGTDLGKFIRYERKSRKITLKYLSELTGISISYLNRLEMGDRKQPSIQVVEKLSTALNVPMSSFMDVVKDSRKGPLPLSELLYTHSFTIKDKTLTSTQKETLIEMIEYLTELEWKENKHIETMEILRFLDKLHK